MKQQLLVPDIGDFEKVEAIEVLVKVADQKKMILLLLESDKSSVEVPATHEGTVESVNVKVGDASKGDLLLTLTGQIQSKEKSKKLLKKNYHLIQKKLLNKQKQI